MTVVSNTPVLTNLAALGRFDLLRELFGAVHVPGAVREQLPSAAKL